MSGSRQVLLRRVQAVVEVPVKEESVGPQATESGTIPSTSTFPASISSLKPTSVPAQSHKPSIAATRVKRKTVVKRSYAEEDDDWASVHSNDTPLDASSDDDDELMMGAEVGCCVSSLNQSIISFTGQPQSSLRYKAHT